MIVPVIRSTDMKRSVRFYTHVLDFRLKYPREVEEGAPVVDLIRDGADLQLSTLHGDGPAGVSINVRVPEVDDLFEKFVLRGLEPRSDSPVHAGPIDQTWGTREFYVTDPDGNTLRFQARRLH